MDSQTAIDVTLFKLKAGVDEGAFRLAAEALTPELGALSGFVRRELLQGDHGQWLQLIYWRSRAEAYSGARAFSRLPSAVPFEAMIEGASVTILHFRPAPVAEAAVSALAVGATATPG